jgi:competence protein ComEC
MLLTGDAEAEAATIEPGPVDVLKVAHHGSEDRGLAGLLARSAPRAAIISAGAGNPHGHPTSATLSTLSEAGVRTFRTDRDGDVRIVAGQDRWEIRTESGD